ncbi:MAG: DNA-binding protein WhiA [Candidatus Sericytochromatia bacterium]
MSFSREVRNQLAQLPVEKPCCQHSQLLALTISSASEARSVNGQPHLVFLLDNAAVARHLFKLGKAIFHQTPVVTSRHGTGHLKHGAGHLMHQVAIPVGESGRLPATLRLDQLQEAITKKACCRRSFLRGIFMGCGSIVSPSKAYHLEFNASEDVARRLGGSMIKVLASQQRSETYTDGHVFLGAVIGPAQMTRDTDPVDVLERAKEIDRAFFEAYAGVPLLERTGAIAVGPGVSGVPYTSEPNGVPPSFWTWSPPTP